MIYRLVLLSFIFITLFSWSSIGQDWRPIGTTVPILPVCENCYRLTDAQISQAGCLWNHETYDFNTMVSLNFILNFGARDYGADGICLILANAPAQCGGTGGDMAANGISNSVIFEFDTYTNSERDSVTYDHVGMNINGIMNTTILGPFPLSFPNVEDGMDHQVNFTWNPASDSFRIVFDGVSVLRDTFDIINEIGTNDVFIGFSASTGGLYNEQIVCLLDNPNGAELQFLQFTEFICEGDSFNFMVSSEYDFITWSAPSDASILGDGESVTITFGSESGEVCIFVDDGCGRFDTACLFIEVEPKPQVIPIDPPIICQGFFDLTEIEFENHNGEAISYYATESNAINQVFPIEFPFEVTEEAQYWIGSENVSGCYTVNSVQITFREILPSTDPTPIDDVCFGEIFDITDLGYIDLNGSIILDISWHETEQDAQNGLNSLPAIIEETGQYFIRFVSESCEAILPVNVEFLGALILSAEDGELDCETRSYEINSTGDPSWEWMWSGPNNFLSSSMSPIVSTAGRYTAHVTDENGCSDSISVSVEGNFEIPVVSAEVLSCLDTSGYFRVDTIVDDYEYSWTGPNGYTAEAAEAEYKDLGIYELSVTNTFGCEDFIEIEVTGDFEVDVPVFSFTDTLSCEVLESQILIIEDVERVDIMWTGNDLMTSDPEPLVTKSGWYHVLVTAENGCMASDSIFIPIRENVLEFDLSSDTLTCFEEEVSIVLESDVLGIEVLWNGPENFTSTDLSPVVRTPGTYIVTIQSSGRCEITDSIEVIGNFDVIEFVWDVDTLTCIQDMLSVSHNLNDTNISSVNWTGLNGFTSFEVNPILDTSGWYFVEITGLNGCISQDSIFLESNFRPPSFQLEGGIIDCRNSSLELKPENLIDAESYFWQGPEGFESEEASIRVQEMGSYSLQTFGSNGCDFRQSVTVLVDTSLPEIEFDYNDINCDVGLTKLNVLNDTEDIQVKWSGPEGYESFQLQDSTFLAGRYVLFQIDTLNGCMDSTEFVIALDTISPTISIDNVERLSCHVDSVMLSAVLSSDVVQIEWSGPNLFTSTLENPYVNQAGLYSLMVVSENGCSESDVIELIQNSDVPQVEVNPAYISCRNPLAQLIAIGVEEDWEVTWISPFGDKIVGDTINTSESGLFQIEIFDTISNCSGLQSVLVQIDTALGTFEYTVDDLTCALSEQQINLVAGNPDDYTFEWTGPSDFTSNMIEPLVSQPGTYHVEVFNENNGCSKRYNIPVSSNIIPIENIDLLVGNIHCNELRGFLKILDFSGGFGEVEYSIDGEKYQQEPDFLNLKAGDYTVYLRDAATCICREQFQIDSFNELSVKAPNDITINRGESVEVTLELGDIMIDRISWFPNRGINCDTCREVVLSPLSSIRYFVQVEDQNGCIFEISFLITVDETDYYIPNVFSPFNSDGLNDIFYVSSSSSDSSIVEEMLIYDRWGQLIFQVQNAPINDSRFGWDGKFSGNELNPGVFSYVIIIGREGEQQFYSGDLTLLR